MGNEQNKNPFTGMDTHGLVISSKVGEPISKQLPVPVELKAIADTFTADPGEKVWRYTATDTSLDTVLAVNANGQVVDVKRSPTGDAELTFSSFNSKREYVLLDDILGETDNVEVLARRRESITRAMDKRELYILLTAIVNKTAGYVPGINVREYTVQSGDDLYDVIMGMKQTIEDYGDNYALLVGSTAKNKMDVYDKEQSSTLNYSVNLMGSIKALGIQTLKIFGHVELTDGGGETVLLDAKKLVMVAKNSRIAEGKPIKFVRRRISPNIAKLVGGDVNNMQRLIIAQPAFMNVATVDTLAYGIYGFESFVATITNPYAICFSDATSIL